MVNTVTKDKLDARIICLKWTICSFNVFAWLIGASVFSLAIWLKAEPDFGDWISRLHMQKIYMGIYILITSSIIVMVVSFGGCFSVLMESTGLVIIFVGTQVVGFLLGLAGSAVFLDYSTSGSKLEPIIREEMRRLIIDSRSDNSAATLRLIQESVGCCGADGPRDYLILRQPLPSQCRDTVTGNAYFYGCVDELTWFFEEKAGWMCGLTMALCAIQVINVVLCLIMSQALKKEEELNERSYEYKAVSPTATPM